MRRDDRTRAKAATSTPAAEATRRVLAILPALFGALVGLAILYGVGFAGPSLIHNAAHDARHANGFPCH